jgi:PAS domain S-box-containing protein
MREDSPSRAAHSRTSGKNSSEADRRLEAIMAQFPVPMLVFDAPEMVMRFGNREAAEAVGLPDPAPFLGLTPAQIAEQKSWLLFTPQGEPLAAREDFVAPIERGAVVKDREILIQRSDGSRRWFSLSMTPIHGVDGSLQAMVVVFPDITDRKRNEEALRYRRDLEHLINGISTRFVNCAPEETDAPIQEALEEVGRFTGADRSYLFFFRQNEPLMDNTHEWCAPGITPQRETLQGRGVDEYRSFYEPILCSETILIPRVSALPPAPDSVKSELERQGILSIISVPIVFRRKVVGFMGLDAVHQEAAWAADVDSLLRIVGELCANALNHMRTDAALRRGEERYRVVSDIGNHLLYDYSYAVKRLEWMGRIRELTGYDPGEFGSLGIAVWENLVHTDDRTEAKRILDEAIRLRMPYRAAYRFLRKDGTYMPVEDRGVFFYGDDGRPIRMIGSMTDESERTLLQDQLQQAMKMEAMGRLAGGVAHDFNNLLTTIMGNIDLARSLTGDPDGLAQSLEEINRAAESASALTRQLLAFSRRQIIEPQPLDLNGLVSRMELMLKRIIGEDVSLRTELAPGLGTIRADAGQLEQVLVNLAVNARDAMPGGGRLLIRTANAELDPEACRSRSGLRPGPHVELTVSDTGHGMSDEVKRHLFEPFFTTKPQGRGTGLGLATIYGIVKQSGGDMEVSSAVGRGAAFRMLLPRVTAEAAAPPAPAAERTLTGSETILLVEDEEGVRNLAIALLARLGYRVLPASGGAEALQTAAEHSARIELLLTDVVMPGLNGRQLADRLVTIHPEMKVLYTSGYTEDSDVLRGVVGAQLHFIAKPYTPRALAAKIREVLESAAR